MNDPLQMPDHPPVPPRPPLDPVTRRRHKALHNLVGIAIFLVIAGTGYWYFRHSLSLPLQSVQTLENSATNAVTSELNKDISAPPPLKVVKKPGAPVSGSGAKNVATGTTPVFQVSPSSKPGPLTHDGIIAQTNMQRAANGGLPALADNATLDAIASLRLDDMFEKQYFAHVAPDGSSAITVASSVGYSYLAIGENLALGNFVDDDDVVVAWMNSPGHRANILNTHYTEIGVAARKANFDGAQTWIAVQIFGRPSSACASPSDVLKAQIDSEQASLASMSADLAAKKQDIDNTQPQSGDAYNQKVEAYNAEVAQYNDLGTQAKTDVATYNAEVQTFNACLAA